MSTIEDVRNLEWPEEYHPKHPSALKASSFITNEKKPMEERVEALEIIVNARSNQQGFSERDVHQFTMKTALKQSLKAIVDHAMQIGLPVRVEELEDDPVASAAVYIRETKMTTGSESDCAFYLGGFLDGYMAKAND